MEEMAEARRCMYLLLRAPEFEPGAESVPPAARIHESALIFKDIERGLPLTFEVSVDGCRCPALAAALEKAEESGLVSSGDGGYSLTPTGTKAAAPAWDEVDILDHMRASEAKDVMNRLGPKGAVAYLYSAFPGVWNDRKTGVKANIWGSTTAYAMFREAGLSMTRCSAMAGMDYFSFMLDVAKKGIVTYPVPVDEMRKDIESLSLPEKVAGGPTGGPPPDPRELERAPMVRARLPEGEKTIRIPGPDPDEKSSHMGAGDGMVVDAFHAKHENRLVMTADMNIRKKCKILGVSQIDTLGFVALSQRSGNGDRQEAVRAYDQMAKQQRPGITRDEFLSLLK
ncbi:MAG: UPF0175 family protein [Nitrosopumilus sp.]|nr:UPF0175 family protein [Nitrosopumilus sp.]CAI9831820.1 hypothetical protein IBTHAUMO2_450026 [Nitrosopumilaceae archaeon]MDA7941676.1 UPF0175 family protein [Nitrosopumilus sp.]MDA7943749.1 UPF0175 family protein [Nitrosopumilus sp.]MDA7945113.1 UPF0175 family protein [Nitrosopumilus sp.]